MEPVLRRLMLRLSVREGLMTLRPSDWEAPKIVEGSPSEAVPGDELVWVTDEPEGPAHHALEVGLVAHDPQQERVRVLARDGTEHLFDTRRRVVLLRGVGPLLERSRASADRAGVQGQTSATGSLTAESDV
jgi:hypothetical protein